MFNEPVVTNDNLQNNNVHDVICGKLLDKLCSP
jgi:hypothetical protein